MQTFVIVEALEEDLNEQLLLLLKQSQHSLTVIHMPDRCLGDTADRCFNHVLVGGIIAPPLVDDEAVQVFQAVAS